MTTADTTPALDAAKAKFREAVVEKGLLTDDTPVSVSPLAAEQAIGQPSRRDFPIVQGRERVIEAEVNGARGHAFTDSPTEFSGTLAEAMALPLSSNQNRAVFVATLNAALQSVDMLDAGLHCRDEDPEKCARKLAKDVHDKWGRKTVGLIGLNPAIAEALIGLLGAERVHITDLDPRNVGTVKHGVLVWDGRTRTEELIRQSSVVIATGTTLVNGTFDDIRAWIAAYGKDYLIYGVTAAGVCRLMGWDRVCPYARTA